MIGRLMTKRCLSLALVAVLLSGCADEVITGPEADKPAEKQNKNVAIGEFDPAAGKEVVDDQVQISNPITGPLEAYGPLKRKVVTDIGIKHAINLFHATEGRYPKDFDEFMTRIIKQNRINLPTPGAGMHYGYDVENHELVVVRDQPSQKPRN